MIHCKSLELGIAAFPAKPIKPTWKKLGNDVEMTKPGVLLLEFAPVNKSGSSSGLSRDYSWDQKQVPASISKANSIWQWIPCSLVFLTSSLLHVFRLARKVAPLAKSLAKPLAKP